MREDAACVAAYSLARCYSSVSGCSSGPLCSAPVHRDPVPRTARRLISLADGAYNGFDAADPDYSSLSWQGGSLAILDEPRNQQAPFWIADTPLQPRLRRRSSFRRGGGFIVSTVFHPNVSKLMFTNREHVFRR